MPDLPPFNSLSFGYLDANQEAEREPDLLTDGYYDYRDAAYGLATGGRWLLLGPKGSGKTAVLENLRLRWDPSPTQFFTYWSLASFPVSDVGHVMIGGSPGGARTQAAWEFLLTLKAIETLDGDQALHAPATFGAVVRGLRASGVLASEWPRTITRWRSTELRFSAKVLGISGHLDHDDITPIELTQYLHTLLGQVSSPNPHLVALDGLDSFFFEASDEWTSLAGLMAALWNVNLFMRRSGLRVTFVAAVRSDVLDVLPGPNVNKLKEHAAYLDWHAHGIGARNHLWRLVSQKASVNRPQVRDIVAQYMQTRIALGPHTQLPEYFLDHTRLLPRDLVALMKSVQRFYRGDRQITESAARNGVVHYCQEYFVGEIFDNLAGVLPPEKARELSSFQDALRTTPSRFFTYDYVTKELEGELTAPQVKQLLKQMFETGGIGIRTGQHTDFVFRRVSGAGFTTRGKFMLHDALTRAWNRQWREVD